MGFGRAPHHRGAADIDVLDRLLTSCAPSDRFLKGVEVNADEIDGCAADALEIGAVLIAIAHEDAAVDSRMKGLHASIHDLGRTREIAHIAYGNSGVAECLCRAARAEDLEAQLRKLFGKVHDACLI